MADDEELPPAPEWTGKFDEEGLPHGQGSMKYPPPPPPDEDAEEVPGDEFEGNMEHGQRVGQGTYKWVKSGAVYSGQYANNKKNGLGTFTFPDKGVYTGMFVDDEMTGVGVNAGSYTYANGDLYEGDFLAGKRHGSGSYHFKSEGCQLVGEWSEGAIVSGRWVYKDGSMYQGTFDKAAPVKGAYFFSTSQLQQPGHYARGTWQPAQEPIVGKAFTAVA